MDLLSLAYGHNLNHFNISKNLNFVSIKSASTLYIADMYNNSVHTAKKDTATYYSTFSDDNSFVAIKNEFRYFLLYDNFTKKKIIRKPDKISSFGFQKPLIYKDSFFYFVTFLSDKNYKGTFLFKQDKDKDKKKLLFNINDVFLCDNKIHNNVLYAVFISYSRDKLYIYSNNLLTFDENLLEFTIDDTCEHTAMIIPQKNILFVLNDDTKDNYQHISIEYHKYDTFELLHKEEIIKSPCFMCFPGAIDIQDMCNGEYIVVSYAKNGLLVFNTDTFSLKKKVSFPMVSKLTICDNDNFCCASSFGHNDMVVFSPIVSNDNKELKKKIESCFEQNGIKHILQQSNL